MPEQTTARLDHLMSAEPHWRPTITSRAGNLLSHETLEVEEEIDIVREWLG